MKIKYQLTSREFKGSVFFEYLDGVLWSSGFSDDFSLDSSARAVLIKENFCVLEKNLNRIDSKIGYNLTEVPCSIDFESFWTAYGYKVGSKMRAKQLWDKLKDEEKIKAMQYIPTNEEFKKSTGQAKLYPERYIKYKVWEV
jgi:hypothetical protein